MKKISQKKFQHLTNLSDQTYRIAALAIDQRLILEKTVQNLNPSLDYVSIISEIKTLVSQHLTEYASSILLDTEYGMEAIKVRDDHCGLLLAIEESKLNENNVNRIPEFIADLKIDDLIDYGAEGIKFLVFYDVDDERVVNESKEQLIRELGQACFERDIPYFLELLSYDNKITDVSSKEYAALKPRKVIESMKVFSNPMYQVDVLKVEMPFNMNYVEGFTSSEAVYSQNQIKSLLMEQNQATDLPFIYLSAGVSMELFVKSLEFAMESGVDYNGVLCGRAIWQDVVPIYALEGKNQAVEWLQTIGKAKIVSLNHVIAKSAQNWNQKLAVEV